MTESIEDKLRILYDLQLIDSKIDEIKRTRGELPLEIEDMEDKSEGLKTRISRYREELKTFDEKIAIQKNGIIEAEKLIQKYTEQQKKVRNNREFNSITKEIEYQQLEIELCEKKIKEGKQKIEDTTESIEKETSSLKSLEGFLKEKKKELKSILLETEKEEKILLKKSKEIEENIEDRLLKAYRRLRKNLKNGLAVVPIKRGASAGSFFTIPPQVQLEVATRKKIITDEHSGRILIDSALAEEEEKKINMLIKSN